MHLTTLTHLHPWTSLPMSFQVGRVPEVFLTDVTLELPLSLMAEHVLVKAPSSPPLKLFSANLNSDVRTQELEWGEYQARDHVLLKILLAMFFMVSSDWTPHKWGKVCSFPSSREPRHLTDAVSSYIQTWTSDHSDWKEMMFLIISRTPQYINSNINDKNTCIYRVFQTNAVVPHASSSEWVIDWKYAQRWIVLTWIFWLKLFPQWRQLNL